MVIAIWSTKAVQHCMGGRWGSQLVQRGAFSLLSPANIALSIPVLAKAAFAPENHQASYLAQVSSSLSICQYTQTNYRARTTTTNLLPIYRNVSSSVTSVDAAT